MEKFMAFMDKYITPYAAKMGAQRHLVAVRDAFVASDPIIVNGIIATKASLTATKCLCAPNLAAYGDIYLSIKAINFSIYLPLPFQLFLIIFSL